MWFFFCEAFVFLCLVFFMLLRLFIATLWLLLGKGRELIAFLGLLSSWCLVVVGRLFLAVPRDCLKFVIVVFPDHTH